MIDLHTDRLLLRRPRLGDAAFLLRLLNEPAFLEQIGDRGVRTLEQARVYLAERMMASFERFGFGMMVVEHRAQAEPAGLCGLVKREELEDVDLGFAFLPEFWSQGYASEAARAVLNYSFEELNLTRLVAIVAPGNEPSIALLGRLGFALERKVRLANDGEELQLFGVELS